MRLLTPSPRRSLVALATLIVFTLGMSACGGDEERFVRLDVRTDYVPGTEFAEVQVRVADRLFTYPVRAGDNYVRGVSVGTLNDPPEILDITVSLHRATGSRLVASTQRFVFTENRTIVLSVSRLCENVQCPQDNPAATDCRDGLCVDPTCPVGEVCDDSMCSTAASCPSVDSPCGAVECIESSCFFVSNCGDNEACVPNEGCVQLPGGTDAGVDAGMDVGGDTADDTGADVGTDSGPTCEAGVRCELPNLGSCEVGEIECSTGRPVCVAVPIAAGTECRPAGASAECDPAEVCDGVSAECPADAQAADGTTCAGGFCSDGGCGSCQPGAPCTPPGEDCAEGEFQCSGGTATCVRTGYRPSTHVCRIASGICDRPETCTGSSEFCPMNEFLGNETTCRMSSGACDSAEVCSGSSPSCPGDSFAAGGTICRAASGVCDVAEACSGSSPSCPENIFAPSDTVCRGQNGVCDVAETCTGASAVCPGNVFAPSDTVCRASAGICDVPEMCTGSSGSCPANQFRSNSFECRGSAGVCDVAEMCTGSSASCPGNSFATSGTVCRTSAGVCDVAETCTGAGASCPANQFRSSSFVCRSATGVCDVAETCTGSGASCPGNTFATAGTMCAPDNCTTGTCVPGPSECAGSATQTCTPRVCNGSGTCVNGSPTNSSVSCSVPAGEACSVIGTPGCPGQGMFCTGTCMCDGGGCCQDFQ